MPRRPAERRPQQLRGEGGRRFSRASAARASSMLLALLLPWLVPDSGHGCYGVIVGRGASADGAVLFGHNEQNGLSEFPNLHVIPPLEHAPGAPVRLRAGGLLPEARHTYGFIWSELPGLEFSDAYLNEWGVAVASDGCPSREDRRDLTDGGIGYMLRRLVVQRARTAREGVHLAGALVEQWGYSASGRTLVIADPSEAWLVALVQGRHWVAQRVPDDGVVLLPNVYIIGEVDLADTTQFLGAADLIDYAIERGWYDPAAGAPFRFRQTYYQPGAPDGRQGVGQELVMRSPASLAADGQWPFAVVPRRRLTVADVAAILRSHDRTAPLCSGSTQEAAVFQLRAGLPPAIGCVYWRAAAEPCTGLLVPWYAGITQIPAEYHRPVLVPEVLEVERHFEAAARATGPAWYACKSLQDAVNANRSARLAPVQDVQQRFEASLFAQQAATEARALSLYAQDPEAARAFLTRYSAAVAAQALELIAAMDTALRSGGPMPTAVAGPVVAGPAAARLAAPFPNPFNQEVVLPFELAAPGEVCLRILDLAGQELRALVSGVRAAGMHRASWDGRDARGNAAASGVYVAALRAAAVTYCRRVVLVR